MLALSLTDSASSLLSISVCISVGLLDSIIGSDV